MVAQELYANDAATTVPSGGTDAPVSGTQETWTVTASTSFPAASSTATPPSAFHVADPAAPSELILVTNVSGATWTVTRGAESSTPVTHSAGFTIVQVIPAGAMGKLATYYSSGTYYLDNYTGTDDQKMASALSDVITAGGGTILLSPRAHTFANQWATSYNASAVTALRIRGAGVAFNYANAHAPVGLTTCTFTYGGAGAGCMSFQHAGTVEIAGIQFISANAGVPLFYTTYSVPMLHDNIWSGGGSTGSPWVTDAIILGGTTNGQYFQGYGADIRDNMFDGIRQCVVFGGAANGVVVRNNLVSSTCGNTALFGAPFRSNGTSAQGVNGALIDHNLVEMVNYQALVNGVNGYLINSRIGPNTTWDASNYVLAKLDSTCTGNYIDDTVYRGDQGRPAIAAAKSPAANNYNVVSNFYGNLFGSSTAFYAPAIARGGFWLANEDHLGGQAQLVPTSFAGNPWRPIAQIQYRAGTQFSDGVTVSGSPFVTSATAAFAYTDQNVSFFTTNAQGGFMVAAYGPTSWQIAWQASTAYNLGDVAVPAPSNSHLYQCATAGTTSSTQPAWPTSGGTVTDGSAVWQDIGTGITAAQLSVNASASGTAQTFYFGRSGTITPMTTFNNHHILGSGTKTTWVANTAAGSGGTVSNTGNDLGQIVTLTTGTGTTGGLLCTGTPAQITYTISGACSISAANSAAATLMTGGVWVTAGNQTNFTISSVSAPAPSTAHIFNVLLLG